jgi:hypothetical protein
MESLFGHNFSNVRIHQGSAAARIGTIAYTQGPNIHFSPGAYQPTTRHGQRVLGHELTHVVQQRAGRVGVPAGKDLPINEDHRLESAAHQIGAWAAQGPPQILPSGFRAPNRISPSPHHPIQAWGWDDVKKGAKNFGRGIKENLGWTIGGTVGSVAGTYLGSLAFGDSDDDSEEVQVGRLALANLGQYIGNVAGSGLQGFATAEKGEKWEAFQRGSKNALGWATGGFLGNFGGISSIREGSDWPEIIKGAPAGVLNAIGQIAGAGVQGYFNKEKSDRTQALFDNRSTPSPELQNASADATEATPWSLGALAGLFPSQLWAKFVGAAGGGLLGSGIGNAVSGGALYPSKERIRLEKAKQLNRRLSRPSRFLEQHIQELRRRGA